MHALFSLAVLLAAAPPQALSVPLTVEEPSGVARTQWPVTSGIPLPQGVLKDDQAAALFDQSGRELPLQTESLARWPDGSVRWLLLDLQLDLAAHEKKPLSLRCGAAVHRAAVTDSVKLSRDGVGPVTIATGPLRLVYDPEHVKLHGEAWLTAGTGGLKSDQRVTFNCPADGVELRNDQGDYSPTQQKAEITIEESGPIRTCIRVSGHHGPPGEQFLQYVARIHAWRGQPWIRVFYTFINDWPGDLMAKIRSLELGFRPWDLSPHEICLLDGRPGSMTRLFQRDENHFEINGKPAGKRATGWAAMGGNTAGLAVGLREFWQNWPKAITCTERRIGVALCPELEGQPSIYDGKPLEEENKLYYALRGGMYTFKVGVAKTHEFSVLYFPGKPDAKRLGEFFQAAEEPLLATAEPAYACASKALGEFPPADPDRYAGYDTWFNRSFDAHMHDREKVREYGLLNYGDWYGERKVNWGNLEYDLAHGMFIQYLRTGDRRFFLRGQQASQHHIDVDVVHAVNTHLKAPSAVGEIYLHSLNHTGGYFDDPRLPVEKTYQVGSTRNFGHVWVSGDFEHYYLTGDRRTREVALAMSDAMVKHCPTPYGDHIRALGWPMVLVLSAYDATGDKKYLDAATACWKVLQKNLDPQRGWVVRLAKGHCLHPERQCYGNVPFMEGLTLSALARYHRVTGDPEVLRAMTVGIDQIIRECWMEDTQTLRYTACPLSPPAPNAMFLAAEAMAYEGQLTGNREHLRVLREGVTTRLRQEQQGNGKGLAQMVHFMPYGLSALEEEKP